MASGEFLSESRSEYDRRYSLRCDLDVAVVAVDDLEFRSGRLNLAHRIVEGVVVVVSFLLYTKQ